MSCAENVYTCPVKFSSHCLGFLTQGSRIQVTCSMSNDHKDYCTYMYAYECPARLFLVFSIAQCRMPTLSTLLQLNIPHQLPTSPAFPLDARFGESVEPVIFAVTRDFFVQVWAAFRITRVGRIFGKMVEDGTKWNRNINCFR